MMPAFTEHTCRDYSFSR